MGASKKFGTAALALTLFSAAALAGAPAASAQSSSGIFGSLPGSSAGTPVPPPVGGDNGNPGPVNPEPQDPVEPESKLDRTSRTIIAVKKFRDHYGYSQLREQRRVEVEVISDAAQKYAEANLAHFTEVSNPDSELAPYSWPYHRFDREYVAEIEAEPGSEGYIELPPAVDEDDNRYSGARVYRYYHAGSEDLLYEAFTWWWSLEWRIENEGYVNDAGAFVRKGSAEHSGSLPDIHVDHPPAAVTREEQTSAPVFFPGVGYGAVHDRNYIYIVEFGENPEYIPQ